MKFHVWGVRNGRREQYDSFDIEREAIVEAEKMSRIAEVAAVVVVDTMRLQEPSYEPRRFVNGLEFDAHLGWAF